MTTSVFLRATLGIIASAGILAGCSGGSQVSPVVSSGAPSGVRQDTPRWYQYYYTSGSRLGEAQVPVSNGTANLTFHAGTFVALLTSQATAFTGDLTGKTLNDAITVSNASQGFVTQSGGSCGSVPPNVRFYFHIPNFEYTHYWWSNPVHYDLQNGYALISVPMTPDQWSDWNGKGGTENPRAFDYAIKHVTQIGLSFGGGCFFENGATVASGTGSLASDFYITTNSH